MGTQRGREVSCFLEILFKLDDLFLQRKINKAVSFQAHGSKQANGDFFLTSIHNYGNNSVLLSGSWSVAQVPPFQK